MWFPQTFIKKKDGIVLIFAVMVMAIISIMSVSLLITTFGDKEIISTDKLDADLRAAALSGIEMTLEDLSYDVVGLNQYNFTQFLTNNAKAWHVSNNDATALYNPQLQDYMSLFDFDGTGAGVSVVTQVKDNDIFLDNSTLAAERYISQSPQYNLLTDKDGKIYVVATALKGSYRKYLIATVKINNKSGEYAAFADDQIIVNASLDYLVTTGTYADIRANTDLINFSAGSNSTNIAGDLHAAGTITVNPSATYGSLYPSTGAMTTTPVNTPTIKVDALAYCNYFQQYLPSGQFIYFLNGTDQLCYDVSTKTSCDDTSTTVSCANTGWAWNGGPSPPRWQKNATKVTAIFYSNARLRLANDLGSEDSPWETTLIAAGGDIIIWADYVIMKPHRWARNFLLITDNKDGAKDDDIFIEGRWDSPDPQYGRQSPAIILSGDDIFVQGVTKLRGLMVAMDDIEVRYGSVGDDSALRIEYNGHLEPFPQAILNTFSIPVYFNSELFTTAIELIESVDKPL